MDLTQSMPINSSASTSQIHSYRESPAVGVPINSQLTYDMMTQESNHQVQSNKMIFQKQLLDKFWLDRESEMMCRDDIKKYELPLARIWRVMKSKTNDGKLKSDVPILLSKAIELFVQHVTFRAWIETKKECRKTLGRYDIVNAVHGTKAYDFLHTVVPQEQDEGGKNVVGYEAAAVPLSGRLNVSLQPNGLKASVPVQSSQLPLNNNQEIQGIVGVANQNASPLPNGQNRPMSTNEAYFMEGIMGGDNSRRSNGAYFPILDVDSFHFNHNPITDEETVGRRPTIYDQMVKCARTEMPSQRPNGGNTNMLCVSTFQRNNDADKMVGRPGAEMQSQHLNMGYFGMQHPNNFQQNFNTGQHMVKYSGPELQFQQPNMQPPHPNISYLCMSGANEFQQDNHS